MFSEARFPDAIAYGSSGGPQFSTTIHTASGGGEQRNANWQDARCAYDVSHGIKSRAQLDELIAFFRARGGKAQGFRFKDWSDYQLQGEIIALGDGSTTSFQLTKTYSSGAGSAVRAIAKPVASTLSVYISGALQASGFALDDTTGVLSFSSAPPNAAPIAVDVEFDVPVRFDTDYLQARLDEGGHYSWSSIPLIEIRV